MVDDPGKILYVFYLLRLVTQMVSCLCYILILRFRMQGSVRVQKTTAKVLILVESDYEFHILQQNTHKVFHHLFFFLLLANFKMC